MTEESNDENDKLKDAANEPEVIQLTTGQSSTIELPTPLSIENDSSPEIIKKSTSALTPSSQLQLKDSHRINPDKYGGYFRGYVRQDWDTIILEDGVDELRADWVELYFDLIYVACIVHMSAEVAEAIAFYDKRRRLAGGDDDGSYYNDYYVGSNCYDQWPYSYIFTCFAQFGLLTNAWRTQVQYRTHFVFNQKMDDALKVCFMVCVLCMGVFIKDSEAYMRAFLVAYQLLQIVIIFMMLKVLMIPRGKWHAIWFISQAVVMLIITSIILATVDGQCALVWFAIYMTIMLLEVFGQNSSYIFSNYCNLEPKIAIPLNVPHIAERYGLFIMLILGESIISVMSADLGQLDLEDEFVWDSDGPPSQILVLFVVLVFMLTYYLARLYYDCQPSEEAILTGNNNHALRISARNGRLYMYAHQMLFFGLLGLGMGIKITAKHILDTERRWVDVVLPGYSLVAIIIALHIIRIAHPYHAHVKIWIFRGILLLIMIITPIFTMDVNNGVLFGIFFACVVLNLFVDVEGKEKIEHEKEEMREKRELAKSETATSDFKERVKHLRRAASGIGKM